MPTTETTRTLPANWFHAMTGIPFASAATPFVRAFVRVEGCTTQTAAQRQAGRTYVTHAKQAWLVVEGMYGDIEFPLGTGHKGKALAERIAAELNAD